MVNVPFHVVSNSAVDAIDRPAISLASAALLAYRAWMRGNRSQRQQAEAARAEEPAYAVMRGM